MSACTFFGHRDCPSSIKSKLREVLIDLIENHAVDMFYVGQQGAFDGIVHSVLKDLVSVYPHIRYAVVLERFPPKRDEFDTRDYSDTMLPEGIETVHPRFAIHGATAGCSSNPITSLPTSPTPGAAQHSLLNWRKNRRKP